MNERQRKLLVVIKACLDAGKTATVDRLSQMSASTYPTVRADLIEMHNMELVSLDMQSRREANNAPELWVKLSRKGEEMLPRVNDVREMDEAVTD